MQIVGIVGDTKTGLASEAPTEMYVPYRQANQVLPVMSATTTARTIINAARAALLEITLIGPELEADADTTCVAAGAEFDVSVNGVETDSAKPFVLPRGGDPVPQGALTSLTYSAR